MQFSSCLCVLALMVISPPCRAACGGRLTGNFGVITSPGYPGNYPNKQDCIWQIDVAPPGRIRFQFETLRIEPHDICVFDYLQVTDPGMEPSKFCGTVTPEPLVTPGPSVTVTFHSDHSVTDKGFNITYTTVTGGLPEDLMERIDRLEARHREQASTIRRLEAANMKHETDSATLRELSNTVTDIQTGMEEMTRTDSRLSLKYDHLRSTVNRVQQCTSTVVGFTAALTVYSTFAKNTVVKFDNAILNEGNAYNVSTGAFTAPVDGMYRFSLNLVSQQEDKPACAEITLYPHRHWHNDPVREALAFGKDKLYSGSGSTSLTINLSMFDVVKVLTCDNSDGDYTTYLYAYPESPGNIFSGELISALDACR